MTPVLKLRSVAHVFAARRSDRFAVEGVDFQPLQRGLSAIAPDDLCLFRPLAMGLEAFELDARPSAPRGSRLGLARACVRDVEPLRNGGAPSGRDAHDAPSSLRAGLCARSKGAPHSAVHVAPRSSVVPELPEAIWTEVLRFGPRSTLPAARLVSSTLARAAEPLCSPALARARLLMRIQRELLDDATRDLRAESLHPLTYGRGALRLPMDLSAHVVLDTLRLAVAYPTVPLVLELPTASGFSQVHARLGEMRLAQMRLGETASRLSATLSAHLSEEDTQALPPGEGLRIPEGVVAVALSGRGVGPLVHRGALQIPERGLVALDLTYAGLETLQAMPLPRSVTRVRLDHNPLSLGVSTLRHAAPDRLMHLGLVDADLGDLDGAAWAAFIEPFSRLEGLDVSQNRVAERLAEWRWPPSLEALRLREIAAVGLDVPSWTLPRALRRLECDSSTVATRARVHAEAAPLDALEIREPRLSPAQIVAQDVEPFGPAPDRVFPRSRTLVLETDDAQMASEIAWFAHEDLRALDVRGPVFSITPFDLPPRLVQLTLRDPQTETPALWAAIDRHRTLETVRLEHVEMLRCAPE